MSERETYPKTQRKVRTDKSVLDEAREYEMRSAKVTIRDIRWQMQNVLGEFLLLKN